MSAAADNDERVRWQRARFDVLFAFMTRAWLIGSIAELLTLYPTSRLGINPIWCYFVHVLDTYTIYAASALKNGALSRVDRMRLLVYTSVMAGGDAFGVIALSLQNCWITAACLESTAGLVHTGALVLACILFCATLHDIFFAAVYLV